MHSIMHYLLLYAVNKGVALWLCNNSISKYDAKQRFDFSKLAKQMTYYHSASVSHTRNTVVLAGSDCSSCIVATHGHQNKAAAVCSRRI